MDLEVAMVDNLDWDLEVDFFLGKAYVFVNV